MRDRQFKRRNRAQGPSTNDTRRGGLFAACIGVATAALVGCGNNVPSEPLSDGELRHVFMTDREVPPEWYLPDPVGVGFWSDDLGALAPGQVGSSEDDACVQAREQFDADTRNLAMVNQSGATYHQGPSTTMTVRAFSTDDDQDLIDEAFSVSEACPDAILHGFGPGLDEETTEMDSTGASMDGFVLINDSVEDGAVAVIAGQSYGQNHLLATGFSEDPRNHEALEEFIDTAQDRFEEGPLPPEGVPD